MGSKVFRPTDGERSPGYGVVEEIVRAYPALLAEQREMMQASTTAQYGIRRTGQGQHSDPTASAALHELPEDDQRKLQAVRKAITKTHRLQDWVTRRTLIDLIYWRRTHTLTEAAEAVGRTLQVAQGYCDEFVQAVKDALGISDCAGCMYYRPLTQSIMACHYCLDTLHPRAYDEDGCYSKDITYAPGICPYYKEAV